MKDLATTVLFCFSCHGYSDTQHLGTVSPLGGLSWWYMTPVYLEETLSQWVKERAVACCYVPPAQPDVTVVNKFIPLSADSRKGPSSVPSDAEVTGFFKGIAGELGVWKVTVKKLGKRITGCVELQP